MKKLNQTILSALVLVAGLYQGTTTAQAMAVFGPNDHAVVTEQGITANVGMIIARDRPVCTAFASGKNQVTTAADCIDEQNLHEYFFSFVTEKKLIPIEKAKISKKSKLAHLKVEGIKTFLAGAELDETGSAETAQQAFSLVGITDSGDSLVKAVEGEAWTTPVDGLFYHTYGTEKGMAGAPILQEGKVVAVHIGNVVHRKLNGKDDKDNMIYNVAVKYAENAKVDASKFNINSENKDLVID